MATKKINATINYNTKKNSYEIGFSESPKKETPEWYAKETIKNEYLFHFYGGSLKLWCRSAEEVSAEDLETIKTMLKDAGLKVINNVNGKKTPNKKNTKKTETTKTEEPKKEEPKKEEPKKEEPKTEPKKTETKKNTKKTETTKTVNNDKMALLKEALELQARIVAQIEAL